MDSEMRNTWRTDATSETNISLSAPGNSSSSSSGGGGGGRLVSLVYCTPDTNASLNHRNGLSPRAGIRTPFFLNA